MMISNREPRWQNCLIPDIKKTLCGFNQFILVWFQILKSSKWYSDSERRYLWWSLLWGHAGCVSTMKNRELCVVVRLHPDHAQIFLNILVTTKSSAEFSSINPFLAVNNIENYNWTNQGQGSSNSISNHGQQHTRVWTYLNQSHQLHIQGRKYPLTVL